MLEGKELTKRFGGIAALSQVSFALPEGLIVGLIGPNGAGKTTLFNSIAGAFKPSSGQVIFKGKEITGLSTDRICRRGIARTFQVTRPFDEMTCLENVGVAVINRARPVSSPWRDAAYETLRFVGLGNQADLEAKRLNLIEKKRLEMARALATEPSLLMLDEVLGGLNSREIGEAVDLIRKLRDEWGLTVFWIEHVMGAIMSTAQRIIVLDQGKKLMEGTPEEVAEDRRVIHAYLGE
ncbi:MAG: ABC transporter ATP-binding protein [Deltaproteobacteria bacterium]|nr:ABC transporter ATP-binding protein [Deltaproteobacteria bacterium]